MTNKGFTLIELLVVITIIAILATIGAVYYGQASLTARDGRRVGDLTEIQRALEQYYLVNNNYPAALSTISNNTYFHQGAVSQDPKFGAYNYVTCATSPFKYIVCAKMEGTSKGNRGALPVASDACSGAVTAAGNTYYCVGSISE